MVGGDFVPPAKSAKPPRKGHKSGKGSRRRRQIKREHTRQANGGQQEHGSNMVRNFVPPALSNEPPLCTSQQCTRPECVSRWQRNYASRWKNYHAALRKAEEEKNRSEDSSRWKNYYAALRKAEGELHKSEDSLSSQKVSSEDSLSSQKVSNLDGNWPPDAHSFSMEECLKSYRPPPKRRSEHINSSTPSPAERTSQETLTSSRTWNSPTWNSYEHSY